MKINNYLIILIVLALPQLLFATEVGDTLNNNPSGLQEPEYQPENENSELIHIIGFTGLYQNKTFGFHPIFGAKIGLKFNKSTYNLVSELRFGRSKNEYEVIINDSSITTNFFFGEYLGLEYDRLIVIKDKYDLNAIAGLGYDWIRLPDVDGVLRRNGGFAINVGMGFLYKIKNMSGPHIQLFYHFSKIDNKGGTIPNEKSIILRLSYMF